MESRPRAMIAQFVTDPAQRKAFIDSILENPQLKFNQETALSYFDMLLDMQNSLSATAMLAYLNKQDDDDGNTVGMALSRFGTPADRKQYAGLLKSLVTTSLPPQEVVNHLLKENYESKIIAQLFPVGELVDLLCALQKREAEINIKSLHLVLTRKTGKTSVISKLVKTTKNKPGILLRLLNEDVLPASTYTVLAESLKPLLQYIDNLPEDEKTITREHLENGSNHALNNFAVIAANELTRQTIATNKAYYSSYNNAYYIKPNKQRSELLNWLTSSSLPAPIKLACLDIKEVNNDNKKDMALYQCLHHGDVDAYLKLLLSLAKVLSAQTILPYLNNFGKHDHFDKTNVPPIYVELMTQLLDGDVSPDDILEHVQSTKSGIPSTPSNEQYIAYISFLEKLIEKHSSNNVIVNTSNQMLDLVTLGKYLSSSSEKNTDRFLSLLESIAKMGAAASKVAAYTLLEHSNYPPRTVMVCFVEKKPASMAKLVDLLITLKNYGVNTASIHDIVSFNKTKDTYYDVPKIPALVMVEHAEKNPALLFKMINHNLLPEKYRNLLKGQKEALLEYILTLPPKEQVTALVNASTPAPPVHPLYIFMQLRRGMFPTLPGTGTFKTIEVKLKEGITASKDNYINPIAHALIDSRKSTDIYQWSRIHRRLIGLAKQDCSILLKLLKKNLILPRYYADITESEQRRADIIRHIKSLPTIEKRFVLIEAHTENSALNKFLATNLQLQTTIKTEMERAFGDQEKIAALIKAKNKATVRDTKTMVAAPQPPSYADSLDTLITKPSAPPVSPMPKAGRVANSYAALFNAPRPPVDILSAPSIPNDNPGIRKEEKEERKAQLA